MGSTRLPGKTLQPLLGKPLLQRVIERVMQSELVDDLIVATTTEDSDEAIVDFCDSIGIAVLRGEPSDVLSRFAEASRVSKADVVVRITADDPLKDPAIIDEIVRVVLTNANVDYASNTIRPSFPEGLDCEVIRATALSNADKKASKASDREHVTPYIYNNPQDFCLVNIENEVDFSNLRWTVDYKEDFEFVEAIYKGFEPSTAFSWLEVISYLHAHPDIAAINRSRAIRNEGYLLSLEKEKADT